MARTRRVGGVHTKRPKTKRESAFARRTHAKRPPVRHTTERRNETLRPRSTRAILLATQRLLQPITTMRTRLLEQQRTAKIPRAHRFIELAKSPEALHAIITRLAALPAQPILHFSVPDPTEIVTDENVSVYMKNLIPKEIARDAPLANIIVKNPENLGEYQEDELILEEALRPTGLIYLDDGEDENDENENNENENNENENQGGGALADDYFDVNLSGITINPILLSAIREDYTGVEKFDIPIYIVTFAADVPGGGHMSILIIYRSVVYSLGFGYYAPIKEPIKIGSVQLGIPASLIGKGTLYNPDYLIDPKKVGENMSIRWKYNIVDFGYCKPIHLSRIMHIANKNISKGLIDFSHGYFKTTMIPLNVQYHAASCATISSAAKGMLNCTTFVEYIFREKVRCALIPYLPLSISHPKKCKRIQGKVTSGDIKRWFAEYGNAIPTYSAAMHAFLSAGF